MKTENTLNMSGSLFNVDIAPLPLPVECPSSMPFHADILTMPVAATTIDGASDRILNMIKTRTGKYVCVSNVHMCMEAFDSPAFNRIVRNANLIVPDGKPLVWSLKALGFEGAGHVRGVDLMLRLCRECQERSLSIGLYGGSPDSLEKLVAYLCKEYPSLTITFIRSPPYHPLSKEENDRYIHEINDSRVDILFVGIGCPKQEKWMAQNRAALSCTMLGVGAAFDFLSGHKKQAPAWMQKCALEWLHRLASNPRRLWKRYLQLNPRFVWNFSKQLMQYKLAAHGSPDKYKLAKVPNSV